MAPTQLEIKVKALQRLQKEEGFYQQELRDQEAHVASLKERDDVDAYDLKKQIEILEDTKRLLPTLYTKIAEFRDNLSEFVDDYAGSESLEEARSVLESSKEVLKRSG